MQWLRPGPTTPSRAPAPTRSPGCTAAATGSTELRSPSSCSTVSTGRSTTTPANVTVPARGARTGVPAGASRSTPRCPAAHRSDGPSNACTTTTGSTGVDHGSRGGPAPGATGAVPCRTDGASAARAASASARARVRGKVRERALRDGMGQRCRAPGATHGPRGTVRGTTRVPAACGRLADESWSSPPSAAAPRGSRCPGRSRLSGRLLLATGACRSTSRVITDVPHPHRPRYGCVPEGRRWQRSGFARRQRGRDARGAARPGRRRQPDQRVRPGGPAHSERAPAGVRRKDVPWPS